MVRPFQLLWHLIPKWLFPSVTNLDAPEADSITGNITFLGRSAVPLGSSRKPQEKGDGKDNLLHISDFN